MARHLCCSIAALIALGAAPASAAALKATPDTLWPVVKAAHPGDVVLMAPGAYPAVTLNAMVFAAPGITLRPANPSHPPVLASLTLNGSQGIRLNGLEIDYTGTAFGLTIAGSSRVYAEGLNIHSKPGTYGGNGLLFRNATDVSIVNSEVHDLGTGISHIDNAGVLISGNIVHAIQSDGIRGGGSSNLEISHNLLYDFSPQPADHPDAIQFWNTKTNPRPGPIRITDNVVVRAPGQPPQSQGIFGGGAHDLTVSGNLLLGTMFNGIGIADVQTATIHHNFVQGFKDMWSGINVRDADGVDIHDNFASSVNLGNPQPTHVSQARNGTLPLANIVDPRQLDRWSAARRK